MKSSSTPINFMSKVNHYHCDISVCSDGSLDLKAYDKDYLMFFTGFKVNVKRANARREVRDSGKQRKRLKIDDLLNDFTL